MEQLTNFNTSTNIYNGYDFDTELSNMNNKLFATFTTISEADSLIENLTSTYDIMYNKIFLLSVNGSDELIATYNVDQGNISRIPDATILVHRKKETNTLYSINALNELIKENNDGYLDKNYRVNWRDFRNTIMLTQVNELKLLKTKIYKIIEV